MLRIEVSLPPDLNDSFSLAIGTGGQATAGDTVLAVVVLECGCCKTPFVRCPGKREHRFCSNENCRKYAYQDRKAKQSSDYEPETGG